MPNLTADQIITKAQTQFCADRRARPGNPVAYAGRMPIPRDPGRRRARVGQG